MTASEDTSGPWKEGAIPCPENSAGVFSAQACLYPLPQLAVLGHRSINSGPNTWYVLVFKTELLIHIFAIFKTYIPYIFLNILEELKIESEIL